MKRLAVLVLLLAVTPAVAKKDEDYGGGSVVFAKGTSLWRIDPEAETTEIEIVALPGNASDVTMVRSNADGSRVLFELGGAWYWGALEEGKAITPEKLACAAGPARFTADGTCVVCAGDKGGTLLVSTSGKSAEKAVPSAGTRVVVSDGVRSIVWADADGVWSAPVKKLDDKHELAPDGPISGFLASPDGTRGIAVYPGHVFEKKQKVEADVVSTFALDGTAARRLLFKTGEVIDWSWDSQWILLQDGELACIARAVGGEYKCWKGYAAQSLSPDGRWGLVRGADNPQKLYRVRLEGAHTEKPKLVKDEIEGAALWLPGVVTASASEN